MTNAVLPVARNELVAHHQGICIDGYVRHQSAWALVVKCAVSRRVLALVALKLPTPIREVFGASTWRRLKTRSKFENHDFRSEH